MTRIRTVKIKAQGNIVEYCKELLARAKAGEIVGVAAATIETDGNCSSGWALSKYGNHLALIGQVGCLQAELVDEIRGDDGDDEETG